MNKTTLVVLFAFLPIVCGGVMGMILGGVDPASATRFLDLRRSSVRATMLGHGALWGIMISGAQMAIVLAAVLLFQRGKKSAVVR